MSNFSAADTERNRSQCSVGASVTVAAYSRHSGKDGALFGRNHMNDSLRGAAQPKQLNATFCYLPAKGTYRWSHDGIALLSPARRGGYRVVYDGQRARRISHREIPVAQLFEGRQRRHVVKKDAIQRQQVSCPTSLGRVGFPNLFEQGPAPCHGRRALRSSGVVAMSIAGRLGLTVANGGEAESGEALRHLVRTRPRFPPAACCWSWGQI